MDEDLELETTEDLAIIVSAKLLGDNEAERAFKILYERLNFLEEVYISKH